MKKIFTILITSLALTVANAQVTKATLQASGLTCAMCSKAVYKALSAVPFVEKVQADIQESSYELSFKAGTAVDFDALSKAVVDAGFSVSMLKVTTRFNNNKVENDTHITMNEQIFHFLNVSSQTLQGEKVITLLDKNFVTAKAYKKYSRFTTMKCYETGVMAGARVYHVTI